MKEPNRPLRRTIDIDPELWAQVLAWGAAHECYGSTQKQRVTVAATLRALLELAEIVE